MKEHEKVLCNDALLFNDQISCNVVGEKKTSRVALRQHSFQTIKSHAQDPPLLATLEFKLITFRSFLWSLNH